MMRDMMLYHARSAERPEERLAQARELLGESDALASRAEDTYHDILFLNAFHRWTMARAEGNGTREKIAFGRLRHLRSLLQRRFPEVDAFDRHIEGTFLWDISPGYVLGIAGFDSWALEQPDGDPSGNADCAYLRGDTEE